MKLERKEPPISSQTVKITLDGPLALSLEAYRQYYEVIYHEKIIISELLTGMAESFIKTDREFLKWKREQAANDKSIKSSKEPR